ncbi:MAG TPA: extracellular solute-binding protein [Candidatus Eisenbergiella merdavium]|uniref:Extracellular solute-binding protein n=1 Tax=Candidatus Eisenbergiella merdavium TaxID=2838551 RepID=A0A9D2SQZ2_9FIRM|nr:extracellular solute-binding protein [Candidatus Eisenbergiella merdavium]
MKKRRLTSLVMALTMMAVLVTGCGDSGTGDGVRNTTPETGQGQVQDTGEEGNSADPFGRYDEPVEISAVKNLGAGIEFPEGDSLEDNVWTRYLEETMNIRINWKWSTNTEQYAQKVNIAITSDDIPDVMQVSASQLKMMYDNGQIMDITEVMDTWLAPYTEDVLNSDGGIAMQAATFDGRLYAIPKIGSPLMTAKVLWVRTDWLDNLGLELPETVEDMRNIAEAFTTQDPDGNGVDDTYGLALYKDLYGSGFADLTGFFNAYNAYPGIWVDKGEEVVWGGIQPEVKEALAALNEMYEAGQIDPEFGVKDANKVNEDVSAGRIGMLFGDFWDMAWINDAKVNDPTFEWVPVAIPSLDAETPAKAQLSASTTDFYVISTDCEHPEAVVKMLNLQLEKSYGETAEPQTFNITPDGFGTYQYPAVAIEPPMKNFTAAQKVTAVINGEAEADTLNDEELNYYEMACKSLEGDHKDNNWHQLKMYGPGGALNVIYDEYWTPENVVNDAYYAAPTETMTEKLPTLNKQQLQDYTTIILEGNLDAFDEFVTNWNKLGGEEITQEVNDWYTSQK